ncbi:MAG: ribose 5-phosphate isomerase B [Acutalibacteraceae bacterium]
MKIALGSDHAGFELKEKIKEHLESFGFACEDLGTFSKERTHYPIYGEKVAKAVVSGEFEKGIVVCGTGVGISIAANKVRGIRCVVCSEPYSALLSRRHNDTNMLALGSRVVGEELALMIVDTWISGDYEGERHAKRVEMIAEIERKNQE